MGKRNVPKIRSNVSQSALAGPAKSLAFLGPVFFSLAWMAFGLVAFVQIHAWGVNYDRKLAMIERGEVKPQSLYVLDLHDDSRNRDHRDQWRVNLGETPDRGNLYRWDGNIDDLQIGSTVPAYRFNDDYLIPRFDRGGHHTGKWVFLGFGLLPLPVMAGVLVFKMLRRRSLIESSTNIPKPKAFSLPCMSFDRVPDDSQLVCLLGDPDCGAITAVEEAGLLTVRPWLFPMKFVAPWMVFTLVAITAMAVYFSQGRGVFLWLSLAFAWFLCLPGFLGVLAVINRSFAKKGDYFKVDLASHTLELCQVGRVLKGSEIIAITLLTRWYCDAGGLWQRTHQTGVLVRARDGQTGLYPVVRELGENVPSFKRSKWADRLAGIFQVPIRKIELSQSESRALNDC